MKKNFLLIISVVLLSTASVLAQTYIITNSGTSFAVNGSGSHATLQTAINFIRTSANGSDCTIQLGVTGGELNMGGGSSTLITFNGNGTPSWGEITLTGIATTSSTASNGIILLENGVSLESKAKLTATGAYAQIFHNNHNNSNGMLTISGGEITTTGYGSRSISNNLAGTVIINDGEISTIEGSYLNRTVANYGGTITINGGKIFASGVETFAVYSDINGTVIINGGEISVTGELASAVRDADAGTITITGGEISATYSAVSSTGGTIIISGGEISATEGNAVGISKPYGIGMLTISGGKISTTGGWGNAVNCFEGTVTINGGEISATGDIGCAISNLNGTITITSGVLFSYGTKITDVICGNYTQSGDAVVFAWNKDKGITTYTSGTSTDIFKHPTTATAVWEKQGNDSGISYSSAKTDGFLPIVLVTVKLGYDMSDITFDDLTVDYDGNPHSIYIKGDLPTGVAVSYEGNNQIEKGEYEVIANFTVIDSLIYNTPESMKAKLTIKEGAGIASTTFNKQIQVYPNPTTGDLRISSYELGIQEVKIFDIYGKELLSLIYPISPEVCAEAATSVIDISHLSNGIYFLRVKNEVVKIVKQ